MDLYRVARVRPRASPRRRAMGGCRRGATQRKSAPTVRRVNAAVGCVNCGHSWEQGHFFQPPAHSPRLISLRGGFANYIFDNIEIMSLEARSLLRSDAMPKGDHLGEAEQKVLLSLWRQKGDAHGASIQAELEETVGRTMTISAIHVIFMRLQEKGLVSSHLGSPTPVRGGKARRIFHLERAGNRGAQGGQGGHEPALGWTGGGGGRSREGEDGAGYWPEQRRRS